MIENYFPIIQNFFPWDYVEEAALNRDIMSGVQDDGDMEAGKGQDDSYAHDVVFGKRRPDAVILDWFLVRCMSRQESLVFLSSPPGVRFPGIVPRVNEHRTGCFMHQVVGGPRYYP